MSTQPPVRFENYPPDPDETREGMPGTDDPHPVVRPYVPATIPDPATTSTSRRMVIGLVIGIPIAGFLLSAIAAHDNSDGGFGGDFTQATASATQAPDGQTIAVGDYSSNLPEGWTVTEDGNGIVEVMNGANRLTAVLIGTEADTAAVEEIARLAERHYSGFAGKISDPVDRSSADLQHATMDGTGTFGGVAARLLVEVWINDAGLGLLIARVMTARASSPVSAEAQELVEALSGDF